MTAERLKILILGGYGTFGGRSGEVLGARWEEVDRDRAVWTVPANRMKAGREHHVPLSKRALEIVKSIYEDRNGEYLFTGQKPGKPLSVMALEMVLDHVEQALLVSVVRVRIDEAAAEGDGDRFCRRVDDRRLVQGAAGENLTIIRVR